MYTTSTLAATDILPFPTQGQTSRLQQPCTPSSMIGAMPANQWVVLTCHYCNKPGHTANVCFAKKKEKKKRKDMSYADVATQGMQVPRTQTQTQTNVTPQASVRPKTRSVGRGRGGRTSGHQRTSEPSTSFQPMTQPSQPTTTSLSSLPHNTTSSKFCSVHNSSSHSTDECRLVRNLSRDFQSMGTSSGEGYRASSRYPT